MSTNSVQHAPVSSQVSSLNPSLEVQRYTLERPSGWSQVEVNANAAAIAPLIRMGWRIVDVDGERGYAK